MKYILNVVDKLLFRPCKCSKCGIRPKIRELWFDDVILPRYQITCGVKPSCCFGDLFFKQETAIKYWNEEHKEK